jgi:uncharacterized protein
LQINTTSTIIKETKNWISHVVIGCNFCPFAAKELNNNTIKYVIDEQEDIAQHLEKLIEEAFFLQNNPSTETTLIIYPTQYQNFHSYLHLVDVANALLEKQGFYGIFQLATFHPDYCFEGEDPNDASNYTNRSLYPMLHLLREESIYKIAKSHEAVLAQIPEKNIAFTLAMGSLKMKALMESCREQ